MNRARGKSLHSARSLLHAEACKITAEQHFFLEPEVTSSFCRSSAASCWWRGAAAGPVSHCKSQLADRLGIIQLLDRHPFLLRLTKYYLKAKHLPYLYPGHLPKNIQVTEVNIQTRLPNSEARTNKVLHMNHIIALSISSTHYLFIYAPHNTKRHVDDSITALKKLHFALSKDDPILCLLLNIWICSYRK